MKKYEWFSTENAPAKYPMQILKGNYVLEDDEILGISKGSFLVDDWGRVASISIVGDQFKALPKQLNLTWFSFTENKFFSDTCNLPLDKIKALFKEGFISPNNDEKNIFRYIIIGLAPNGKVILWASQDKITKEICALDFKEDKNIKWEEFMPNPDYPMKRYVRAKLEQTFKEKDFLELEKNGVDTLLYIEKYRQHFMWGGEIVGSIKPLNTLFYFYNGESEYNYNNSEEIIDRPVPNKIKIKWVDTKGRGFSSEILFDEEEVFPSFELFMHEHKSGSLQLQFEISDLTQDIRVLLRNDTYIYEFKKCTINVYKQ